MATKKVPTIDRPVDFGSFKDQTGTEFGPPLNKKVTAALTFFLFYIKTIDIMKNT